MSDLITPAEFAERWGGVTTRWVLESRLVHQWPCVKVGRTIRFTEDQYAEIKRRHTVTASGREKQAEGSGRTARSAARSA